MPFVPSQATSQTRETIAANLDRAISAKGWTNRFVGEAIGKTEHQVWRWRRAKHDPSLDTLAALANLLFEGDIARFYDDVPDRSAA